MALRRTPPRKRIQGDVLPDGYEMDEDTTAADFRDAFSPKDRAAADEDPWDMDEVDEDYQDLMRLERLNALGLALSKTRSEAINHRLSTGIEGEWVEDEEFYEGIDDANRGERRCSTWHQKPAGQAAPASAEDVRSTIFINITRPYVDAAAARVGDMLLPVDDRGWVIEATPVPALAKFAKGEIPDTIKRQALNANGGNAEAAEAALQQEVDRVRQIVDDAKAKAERAQQRIDDWHCECQYEAHMRQVIEDATRIGTGVLKGPIIEERMGIAYVDGRITVNRELIAASRRIDVWNLFPDPACGDNIHSGSFIWERDFQTRSELEALKSQPGYIAEAIDKVLEEGPLRASPTYDAARRGEMVGLRMCDGADNANLFELWHYHGTAQRDDLEAAGVKVDEGVSAYHTMFVMVNNTVIKALLTTPNGIPIVHEDDIELARVDQAGSANPAGSFPYDVMVYQRRAGYWAGISMARQIRAPQRMLNGAVRNMMDNAGIAGGPMLAWDPNAIEPVDGKVRFAPRKFWKMRQNTAIPPDKAIHPIKIDMMQNELQAIIMLALKFAEDITGLPAIMQGQQGSAPDTVGGMQILNNNASTILRRIARLWDDLITEPHIRRKYEYLMLYGDDEEKGDFAIQARGSSALVERDLENQEIAAMASIVSNPIFGIDPKKWATEYLKSRRLNPKSYQFDDEEWRQVVESMSQKPDPRLEIAQMNAQIKQAELEWKSQEAEKDRALESAMKEIDVWIDQQKDQGHQEIELNKIRERMESLRAKLEVQRELSQMSLAARQADTPPTEPAGRAPAGQAFAR